MNEKHAMKNMHQWKPTMTHVTNVDANIFLWLCLYRKGMSHCIDVHSNVLPECTLLKEFQQALKQCKSELKHLHTSGIQEETMTFGTMPAWLPLNI